MKIHTWQLRKQWDAKVATAWLEEVERRAQSVEAGREETFPVEEVLAEAYARLHRKR